MAASLNYTLQILRKQKKCKQFAKYNILCKSFANKNCLHFSANKIVRKQMDANNANNFSKHIGIKVKIFWVKLLNFQWNQLQKTIIWPKIIIGKFICIKKCGWQKSRNSQEIHKYKVLWFSYLLLFQCSDVQVRSNQNVIRTSFFYIIKFYNTKEIIT